MSLQQLCQLTVFLTIGIFYDVIIEDCQIISDYLRSNPANLKLLGHYLMHTGKQVIFKQLTAAMAQSVRA